MVECCDKPDFGITSSGGLDPNDFVPKFGNVTYVTEDTDLALVGGEREIPGGHTVEFGDNLITGMAPLFLEPLRIPDNSNCIIQAPLTLNAIVSLFAGPFINSDAMGLYVQNNVVFVTPAGGTLYDMTASTTINPIFFCDNFAYLGLGLGSISGFNQAGINTANLLDWTSGFNVVDCVNILFSDFISPGTPSGVGPSCLVSGDKTESIRITSGSARVLSGQSYLGISPDIADQAVLVIKDNLYLDTLGGDFFLQGDQGTITAFTDNSATGTITAMADNGAGGTTITHTGTNPGNGRKVTQSGTTEYNGTFRIFNSVAGRYDIDVAFVTDEAAGTWDFNSVIVTTTAAHGQTDGTAIQITKTTYYNFGRVIFNASGSVFSIDDVVFNGDDAAGTWDSGSLKENDPRMTCEGNGDQPDTSALVNLGVTATEVLTGTSTAQTIETWAKFKDNQFTLNAPGEVLGSWRYDGRNNEGGLNMFIRFVANSGNPGAPFDFIVSRSRAGGGFIQIGPDITALLTNAEQTLSIFIEEDLQAGDVMIVQALDPANNSINILNASISQYKIG